MKNLLLKLTITSVCLLMSTFIFADPGFEDNIDDVPFDGGLTILLAAGIGYGARKAYEQGEKKNQAKK